MRKIDQYNYNNKRVLLRVDLNVPISNGKILDDTRINKIISTIKYLADQNAKIILVSHFGRPKSASDAQYSLKFLVEALEKKLGQSVLFSPEIIGKNTEDMSHKLKPKQILLLENIRFHAGETKNDPEFAAQLAKLADFYINDAFSCSHRAHASIAKIAEILPSCAGLLLAEEVGNLTNYLTNPQKPMMAIIGGSKVSTKLDLLNNLIHQVDYLVIGGAMANTFLKAQNHEIGTSFYEKELLETARNILSIKSKCQIILPQDVVVANEIASGIDNKIVDIKNIPKDQMILDVGPESTTHINQILKKCKTVICNGPLGVFEHFPFSVGTTCIAREIAKLTRNKKLLSVAGGGDIVAALSASGLFKEFSYISTAGGAFLEWLEGKKLPGIETLSD